MSTLYKIPYHVSFFLCQIKKVRYRGNRNFTLTVIDIHIQADVKILTTAWIWMDIFLRSAYFFEPHNSKLCSLAGFVLLTVKICQFLHSVRKHLSLRQPAVIFEE